ncbi:NAD(P)/FAD-dependent oxidoreductase [Marinagarivorans algicola]|uniref:NAD(P)/FAD-dependent oxidoreductase n=1 Tax=Marinagarivorans algicola TaxID=1513270 RepID=UPI0006B89FD7|nr:NAD(P)/FAD-dependent oxidoreductase [Marinagarivorans algicola]
MLRINQLILPLDHTEQQLNDAVLALLGIEQEQLLSISTFKRGFDARQKNTIKLIYTLDVDTLANQALLKTFSENPNIKATPDMQYRPVAQAPESLAQRPIVIGFGPCGLFIALILAQMGFKPIVLERGKDVKRRTKDTWDLWRGRTLHKESNVQFGEGGAGTFSDGKLYSQIKDKRHLSRKVLREFVLAGAPAEIELISKPHIGTFKLVKMVQNMRQTIIELGGEIRFDQKVEDLIIDKGHIKGVTLASGEQLLSEHVAIAVGHSARDTFEMLVANNVHIEAKPFSVGFRIEHPQSMIDDVRFGPSAGNALLGAADYKLVHHCKNNRTVYSFCMCPGGTVVAATSEEGQVVSNGMSQYSRNERNANAAIVVGIDPATDYPGHPLAGIELQRKIERAAYDLGGQNYNAPAQLVGDFLKGRPSTQLGDVTPSYQPGVTLTDLAPLLPDFAIAAIREAIPAFNKKIKGFAREDAILTAAETRTSSPICVKRDNDTLQSISTQGLYPGGEGAGYAGGILSAAVDGIKVAEAMALAMTTKYAEN